MNETHDRDDDLTRKPDLPVGGTPQGHDLVAKFFNAELSVEEQHAVSTILSTSPADQKRFAFFMESESRLLRQASKRQLSASQGPRSLTKNRRAFLVRPPRTPVISSRAWLAGITSSVAIVLLALFGGMQPGDSHLSAAQLFKQLEHVSHLQFDRVYSVERLVRQGGATTKVQGELSCRGIDLFVVKFPEVVVGGGVQSGFWCVPTSGAPFKLGRLSEINDANAQLELGWLEVLLEDSDETIAFGATKVLALIRANGYEIVRGPNETAHDGREYEVLTCQLRYQDRLPRIVTIRARQESHEIVRIDFDWATSQRPNGAELLSIELRSVGRLPATKYEMDTYVNGRNQAGETSSNFDEPDGSENL